MDNRYIIPKRKDMKTFEERITQLRLDMIAYIEDYLAKANRSIIVPLGGLTYMDWDSAFFSTNPEDRQVVPETEITMIYLSQERELRFLDANNNEVYPSALDTEELGYVVDYIDTLDLAPVDEQ